MGMGYGGNYADVIEFEGVKEIVPEPAKKFEDFLEKNKIVLSDAIKALAEEDGGCLDSIDEKDYDHLYAELETEFEVLNKAFQEQTKVGGDSCLELTPMFHDEDSGDRYDEVEGGFFHVDGMYCLSPAGEKFKGKIERKFFVSFG